MGPSRKRTARAIAFVLTAAAALSCVGAATPGPIIQQAESIARQPRLERNRTPLLISVSKGLSGMGMSARARQTMQEAAEQARGDSDPNQSLRQVVAACVETGMLQLAGQTAGSIPLARPRIEACLQVAEALNEAGQANSAAELAERAAAEALNHYSPRLAARWLERAAEQARRAGRTERARQLLNKALQRCEAIAHPGVAAEQRAEVAVAMAQAGDYERAAAAAALVDGGAVRARGLLRLAAVAIEAGAPSADDLWQGALEAGSELATDQWVSMLDEVASVAVEAGRQRAALRMAREIEQVAMQFRRLEEQDEAVQAVSTSLLAVPSSNKQFKKAADLYGKLGRWQEAARLADLCEEPYDRSKYRVRAAVELREAGDLQAASAILADLDPRYITHSGEKAISGLGRLYREMHPAPSAQELAGVGSPVLRRELVLQCIVQAVRDGDLQRARELLGSIQEPGLRSAIARDSATTALQSPQPAELTDAIAYARAALGEVRSEREKPMLRFLLGKRLAQTGDTEGAAAVARQMADQVERWSETASKAKALSMLSAIQAHAGLTEQAAQTARRATRMAHLISCASCRYGAIQGMFEHLCEAGDLRVLVPALKELKAPDDKVNYSLEALSALPQPTEEARRSLLQLALAASTESWSERKRVSGLMRVAAAYREHGFEPGAAEADILSKAPDTYVPATPAAGEQPADGRPLLVYFTQEGCALCRETEAMLGQAMSEQNYRGGIAKYDLDSAQGARLNKALCTRFNLPSRQHLLAPALFNGVDAAVGRDITELIIFGMLQQTNNAPSPLELIKPAGADPAQPIPEASRASSRWRALGVAAAMGAAFALLAGLLLSRLLRRAD